MRGKLKKNRLTLMLLFFNNFTFWLFFLSQDLAAYEARVLALHTAATKGDVRYLSCLLFSVLFWCTCSITNICLQLLPVGHYSISLIFLFTKANLFYLFTLFSFTPPCS